ncbi:tautomerase family protein [Ensifer soli]|uniref:tautomerase family protein n=1 Tax=Ciceribacter sp. sgz301302 TaxID=3342379 RepID=UPI0035BADE17
MPHVVVKMIEGRSEAMKADLTERLTAALTGALGVGEETVSVAIEDVPAERWDEDVFLPDIRGRKQTLYRKPGYAPVD